ncbi:zinc ABC transporter substrate-binding protein [Pontivivens ytuae]|uniref:High-affinity zinc uptake system protein ZnuA n=1 Tax=Pontivivens ytuae TaxID=2789856 RepID=A0A7S9QBF0_9RHOB|nr:zinc ABC transporter substrate-binding protein [Pontivivens ytuae]QPH52625.1 zinc ABC transporter substrate-binding protein [Pontivivens ytuae]
MRALLLSLPIALVCGGVARAEVPRVSADIAAVHALVARVMEGVGTPDLLIPPGSSPHGYAMRPSEADALQAADMVFWVSEELTPWLPRVISNVAADAEVVELLEAEGTVLLPTREGVAFEVEGAHDHDHDHGDDDHGHEEHADADHAHDDHGHEEHAHDDHGHEEHAEHADDDHGHDDHGHGDHAHEHGDTDAHAWLDPVNAANWLGVIAAELSEADPANAETYAANAAAGQAEMEELSARVSEILADGGRPGYIVLHDAYQYFETRFDVPATAAVALGDAAQPGARRVAALRELVAERELACAFIEPQLNASLLETVFEGSGVTIATIDPLGSAHEPGAGLYPALILDMATAIAECAG